MFVTKVLLALLLLKFYFHLACTDINSLAQGSNISFVIVGFRHGFRNPIKFIKNDTSRQKYGWGWEGEGQLTNYGKRQAYGLGTFLRNRYKDFQAEYYTSGQIKAFSSSSERCQMTMLSVLAGLHKPHGKSVFEKDIQWQPIPYETKDELLRVFESKCPTYQTLHQPFQDDNVPEAREWLQSKGDLVKYITAHTGFNGSLVDLSNAADNIISMLQSNVPMPDWIENSTLRDYPKEILIQEIVSFNASNPRLCAKSPQCAKPLVGLWLNEIINLLNQKLNGQLPDRKMQLYSTHFEGVMPILRLMGANVSDTPVCSGFILELRPKPDPSALRLLYHEPDESNLSLRNGRYLNLPLKSVSGDGFWYKVDDFIKIIKGHAFDDWNTYCGWPICRN